MRLNYHSNKWNKVHRRFIIISVQLVLLFLLNINPGLASPSQADDFNMIDGCIGFNLAPTNIPIEVDKLCGKLLILKDLKFEKYYLALQVCGGQEILIFRTRPRELVNFYQFREPKISKGDTISTTIGDFNYFITTFKSYIPLPSCSECGKILTPTPRELIGTLPSTQSLIFPTATFSLSTATLTRTPLPSPTISPSPTQSPVVLTTQPALATLSATVTVFTTSTASEAEASPTFEKTPPTVGTPSDLPDNSRFILTGVIAAIVLSLGIGIFYLRKKLR